MNTTTAIFFLILGQAPDGFHATGSSMVAVPHEYPSLTACEAAGEEAKLNNQGLAFLSYTCVFAKQRTAPVKSFTPASASFSAPVVIKPRQTLAPKWCDEVCQP